MKKIILPLTLLLAFLTVVYYPLVVLFFHSENIKTVKYFIMPNAELYEKTDEFVESLTDSEVYSYGISGIIRYEKFTSNGNYKIAPIGRLVNVRIEKVVDDSDYEVLAEKLRKRYKNNPNVNNVYICKAGTVMIDCRK